MEFVTAAADSFDFLHAGRIRISGSVDRLGTRGVDDELDRFLQRS
jgi:hypothetical protein